MIILYGRYRFAPKKTAYRSDYCLKCQSPRLAEQFRTFDAGHLFFIPVLPLGFWKHWHCAACGSDPHRRVATSTSVKILGLFLCLVFVAIGVLIPLLDPEHVKAEDRSGMWLMGIGGMVAFGFLLRNLLKRESVTPLQEGLARIDPLGAETCFYCQGNLSAEAYCERCRVTRCVATTR